MALDGVTGTITLDHEAITGLMPASRTPAPIPDGTVKLNPVPGSVSLLTWKTAPSSKPIRINPGRWIRLTIERTLWLIVVSAIANA